MPKLRFEFDWVDAQGVSGPELSATWASLRILVGDSAVTRVLDSRAMTVREFVYVPLYPLAEWLVANWWFLSYEIATPARESDPDFHRRHALSANRDGYAFPNLVVVPSGARTHLVWTQGRSAWTGVEFLSRGDIWIDSGDFRETCSDLVDRVIRRLEALEVGDTFLQAEWNAIRDADEEESDYCKTAAGLGWDPYALDDTGRLWIPLIADNLGDLLGEALPALNAKSPTTCFTITNAIERAKRNDLPLEKLRLMRDETPPDTGMGRSPWSAGYALARQLRQNLELGDDPIPTMNGLAEAIGEDVALLRKATRPSGCLVETPMVDGVVTRNANENPAFAFRRHGEAGRRFHLCRALAEVWMSPGSDALLTRAYSESQQRNRAFAAEFLAPSSGLRSRVSGSVVDEEDLDGLAVEYGVSSQVVEHQIANHHIARISRVGAPSD